MSNGIRLALHEKLSQADAVTDLVGDRIYFQTAPQGAGYPLVTFSKHTGTPRWAMKGPPLQWDLWLVKAITTGSESASTAEAIAAAIDEVLNDAELDLGADHKHLWLRRDSDVSYPEDETGRTYRHVGALYRVASE